MKLLLAGGGTGGHLFPAVALAQLLLQQDKTAAVQFVGTERGLEQRLLPKLGLPLATVDMVGVVGRGWRGRLELIPKLLKSLFQANKILASFQPDVVVGVGGYASVPVLLAAKMRGVPYLIHEQNAIPGLSNRLLGRWAKAVCLSVANSDAGFNEAKTVLTGNPLRQGFEDITAEIAVPGKLLVFGGSQGARAINETVIEMLPLLKSWEPKPEILHQTGEADFHQVQQAYRQAGFDPQQVVPFIDDMLTAYAQASLVICRAGATTLAELTSCGRAAILIPLPQAAGDHQTANARSLEKVGAAKLIPQADLTADRLAAVVKELFEDREELKRMAEQGRQIGFHGAAGRILNECRRVLEMAPLEGD
ncbi:UDP-N-acetylglucosamine-N-acetylmuramylpentapeptide N-acetylglucosamine transferase [Desulfuromusa kysingii]|uniref:UDP-N-acetylglucosamine--N-acetylmuramyl-(pentapeptide) pyrophosphoryl-undecaprenol N-acetylglucosamine transferase n=1 Tax=Desulfuromusa kysingii TaxID=37625 RepID=A0A1H3ZGK9_9BACT|nr:undecaprenyldiphospho-muramoylpentapeptide beta-N-acetylglucosaminyltransferase [Desulfuromusa kysingii]SEA22800.1 UDP-N-acetylglucosamine-N-acetylmuramylpentapeptide N-acetylglucosamine transferase [Desulfuromusa kysingii]